jgi:hypothetical protein
MTNGLFCRLFCYLLVPAAASFALINSDGYLIKSQKDLSRVRRRLGGTVALFQLPRSRREFYLQLRACADDQTSALSSSGSSGNPQALQRQNLPLTKKLEGLDSCTSQIQAERILDQALLQQLDERSKGRNDDGTRFPRPLYKSVTLPPSAAIKGISDSDLAIQTRTLNSRYSVEDLIDISGNADSARATVALATVLLLSATTAVVANQLLFEIVPDVIRWIFVFVFTFTPFAFIGTGIMTPTKLQQALLNLQVKYSQVSQQRILQHEAGHFLIGHLLGVPVAQYNVGSLGNQNSRASAPSRGPILSAVEWYPLADPDVATSRAAALGFDPQPRGRASSSDSNAPEAVPFFSDDGRGASAMNRGSVLRREALLSTNSTIFEKLPMRNNRRAEWPYRALSMGEVDVLAMVSVAGICAEILSFGQAEGGAADLTQLRQLMTQQVDPPLTDREQNNIIRYSIGFTTGLLRKHVTALDALADAMSKCGTLAECVASIESLAAQEELVFTDEFYQQRRASFLQRNSLFVKREFAKSIDSPTKRFVEVKGGGYRRPAPVRLEGDDPIYLALFLSAVFALWAFSGGLELH